jgi:sarcosine oxidase / L-pipecolate oxidase
VLVSKATHSHEPICVKLSELTGLCHRDASTPTHDFLISPHPQSDRLYIATGGSFHGWKFLPVIGDYVVDMMQGTLDSDLADRWAWDKKGGDGHSANPTYQIVGDLQDWTRGWAN